MKRPDIFGTEATKLMQPLEVLKQTHLGSNMVVADFGCGSGFLAFAAAKMVKPNGLVYAVDIRREALQSIESQKRVFGERSIKTIRADLSLEKSTGIEDESVDLVILATIIFQLPDEKVAVEEAKRVLKQDGEILFLEWKELEAPPGPPRNERFSQEKMKKLIEGSNLKITGNIKSDIYHYGFITKKA